MAGYWEKVFQRRMTRRRAVGTTGALGASAAFLAACGGGDDSGSTGGNAGTDGPGGNGPSDTSGLLYTQTDETAQAVPGGIYTDAHPLVLTTLDPGRPGGHIRVARRGYSQLFRIADGILEQPDGSIEGDLAETWELSPDRLTLTVKLFPGAGFAPVPPVDGRAVDAEDIVFSWERMKESGNLRSELANEFNPAAPIESVDAPDPQTVVITMAQPDVTIYPLLATQVLGGLYILPKEAANPAVIDVARQAIGTGPYYLTEDSEVEYRWARNPNFKRPKLVNGEPFVEEIYEPVITDPATGSSQFRSGALLEYNLPVNEILGAKEDNPELLMRATPPTTFNERLYFGQHADSPFKDERVRRAFMKTLDRDLFIDVAYNRDRFEDAGLPAEGYWEGALFKQTYAGWWLDPQDPNDFPETAENYVYDPDEAQALLDAAGLETPVAFDNTYGAPSPTSFPPSYYARAEIFLGMIESTGLWEQNRVLIDYRTEWSTERFRFSGGNFVGTTWGPDSSSEEATMGMFSVFNSNGGYFLGGDERTDELTNRAKQEFDEQARMAIIHELQRYDSRMMFNEKIGVGGGFALHWPALRNVGAYQGGTNWMGITTPSGLKAWLDQSKRPFA